MQTPAVFHPTRSKYLVFTTDYLLPLSIGLAVLAMAYFVLYSRFFQITTVTCSLDYGDCTDPAVLAELDKLKGQNIFTFSPERLSIRLTSGDFTIRQAKFIKQLPGLITVELRSVYRVVAIQVIGDHSWVVLDQDFRVIAKRVSDPNVPTVRLSSPLTLTLSKPPPDQVVIDTLKLARRLADELFVVKTIFLRDEDTIELTLADGRLALFTPKKDELVQLKTLQTILADATIATGVRIIDVRFASPVLR